MARVLFVCTGNICRSPMAEALLAHRLRTAGIDPKGLVDSAGTGSWHAGETPNRHTIVELDRANVPWCSRARQLTREDVEKFDYLIGMDREHTEYLRSFAGVTREKISLLMHWCNEDLEVPDPYYGTQAGFRKVYEMCDRACEAIFRKVYLGSDGTVIDSSD